MILSPAEAINSFYLPTIRSRLRTSNNLVQQHAALKLFTMQGWCLFLALSQDLVDRTLHQAKGEGDSIQSRQLSLGRRLTRCGRAAQSLVDEYSVTMTDMRP